MAHPKKTLLVLLRYCLLMLASKKAQSFILSNNQYAPQSQPQSFSGKQTSSSKFLITKPFIVSVRSTNKALSSTHLAAKKRLRRRAANSSPTEKESIVKEPEVIPPEVVEMDTKMEMKTNMKSITDSDELPDFDMTDDSVEKVAKPNTNVLDQDEIMSTSMSSSAESLMISENDPIVKQAMQADASSQNFASAKDLLRSRDRNVEATFEFDQVAQSLPKLGRDTVGSSSSSSSSSNQPAQTVGKKRARAEARKAAAMEAAEVESINQKNILTDNPVTDVMSKLPFFPKNDVDPDQNDILKFVEQGTWTCIYILVAWEVYINSPFFDRASPLNPVVY